MRGGDSAPNLPEGQYVLEPTKFLHGCVPILLSRLSGLSWKILVLLPKNPLLTQLETLVYRGFWIDLALEVDTAAAAGMSGRRIKGTFHILIYNNRLFEYNRVYNKRPVYFNHFFLLFFFQFSNSSSDARPNSTLYFISSSWYASSWSCSL